MRETTTVRPSRRKRRARRLSFGTPPSPPQTVTKTKTKTSRPKRIVSRLKTLLDEAGEYIDAVEEKDITINRLKEKLSTLRSEFHEEIRNHRTTRKLLEANKVAFKRYYDHVEGFFSFFFLFSFFFFLTSSSFLAKSTISTWLDKEENFTKPRFHAVMYDQEGQAYNRGKPFKEDDDKCAICLEFFNLREGKIPGRFLCPCSMNDTHICTECLVRSQAPRGTCPFCNTKVPPVLKMWKHPAVPEKLPVTLVEEVEEVA